MFGRYCANLSSRLCIKGDVHNTCWRGGCMYFCNERQHKAEPSIRWAILLFTRPERQSFSYCEEELEEGTTNADRFDRDAAFVVDDSPNAVMSLFRASKACGRGKNSVYITTVAVRHYGSTKHSFPLCTPYHPLSTRAYNIGSPSVIPGPWMTIS